MRLNGKRVHLPTLQAELVTAGVTVAALAQTGDELHTYTPSGAYRELPPEARPVVDAHVPPAPPPQPDYGADVPDDYEQQLAAAVTTLRAYLGASAPTGAQTVAALKLAIRVLLFIARRLVRL